MKILIVQDTDWIRRNPYQHVHLAERLSRKGHQIRVIDYEILWREESKKKELFSQRQVFSVSRVLKDSDITVIRPGILKIPLLDYVSMLFTYRREIVRQISEFKPDVVLGNDILTTFLAFGLARRNRIPTVFYSIDLDFRLIPFAFLQKVGKLIEGHNIRNANLVISINEGLRDYTVSMGARSNKTRVIRAGIDFHRFDEGITGERIRAKYGIKDHDLVLFFMGWLYHFSGLKEVAGELRKLSNREPLIKLLVVGDGEAFEDLRRIRELHHLDSQIILAGRQPYENIPEFVAASDICLLPALENEIMHDIVPIKLYEYMAMGKPVISTRLYGVEREFGENNGVLYVDCPEDILRKSIELFRYGDVKKEGKKARLFVQNNDWDRIADLFECTLEELV